MIMGRIHKTFESLFSTFEPVSIGPVPKKLFFWDQSQKNEKRYFFAVSVSGHSEHFIFLRRKTYFKKY